MLADPGQIMIREVSGKIVTPNAEHEEQKFLAARTEVLDSSTAVAAGGEVTPLQDDAIAMAAQEKAVIATAAAQKASMIQTHGGDNGKGNKGDAKNVVEVAPLAGDMEEDEEEVKETQRNIFNWRSWNKKFSRSTSPEEYNRVRKEYNKEKNERKYFSVY